MSVLARGVIVSECEATAGQMWEPPPPPHPPSGSGTDKQWQDRTAIGYRPEAGFWTSASVTSDRDAHTGDGSSVRDADVG